MRHRLCTSNSRGQIHNEPLLHYGITISPCPGPRCLRHGHAAGIKTRDWCCAHIREKQRLWASAFIWPNYCKKNKHKKIIINKNVQNDDGTARSASVRHMFISTGKMSIIKMFLYRLFIVYTQKCFIYQRWKLTVWWWVTGLVFYRGFMVW